MLVLAADWPIQRLRVFEYPEPIRLMTRTNCSQTPISFPVSRFPTGKHFAPGTVKANAGAGLTVPGRIRSRIGGGNG